MSYLEMALEVTEGKSGTKIVLPKSDAQSDSVAQCGSLDCAGCYLVDADTGAKVHPPKCGEDYRAWLERWENKGRVQ